MTTVAWRDEVTDAALREELDRDHPERPKLRPTDLEGLRHAFDVVEEMWAPTIERARKLGPAIHDRVNHEFSFVETLRHLVFAWEAWLRGVLALPDGYHAFAVPPEMSVDADRGVLWSHGTGWSRSGVPPELDDVLDVRAELMRRVRDYLAGATDADLTASVPPPPWNPQPGVETLYCFRVVLHEEWWHHQFATRDLAVLEAR